MQIDRKAIHPSSPLEEALTELSNSASCVQFELFHFLAAPHSQAARDNLDRALDHHAECARSVRSALAARQAVDQGLPQIAQAVREHRDGEVTVNIPLGEALDRCNDWDAFCREVGLNPWCLNEGLASKDDPVSVSVATARKHGILREGEGPSDEELQS